MNANDNLHILDCSVQFLILKFNAYAKPNPDLPLDNNAKDQHQKHTFRRSKTFSQVYFC